MSANRKLKIASLLIFVLAVLFYVFFMHCKHDPALSTVNAFADDPYDAVGSFGIQAAAILGILCLVRAFRRPHPHPKSVERESFLIRAQIAAILSVGVTLAADAIAMLRHPSLWIGHSAGYRLLALLLGMALPTALMGVWVRRTALRMEESASSAGLIRAVTVSIFATLVLFFYPEVFHHGLIGVLLTAFAGTVILFVCTWAWTIALVPDRLTDSNLEQGSHSSSPRQKNYGWAIVILAGILIGLFFVAGEASEGSGIPHSRLALVVSAYLGLETAGIMVGYGFLGKPLGLFRQDSA